MMDRRTRPCTRSWAYSRLCTRAARYSSTTCSNVIPASVSSARPQSGYVVPPFGIRTLDERFESRRPTKLDRIEHLHLYLHLGDVIGLSPDLAVKPAERRAAGQSSSGRNSPEAHAGPARAVVLWRTTNLGIRFSAVLAGLACEDLSGMPDLVVSSYIAL